MPSSSASPALTDALSSAEPASAFAEIARSVERSPPVAIEVPRIDRATRA
jgi:hypothetical protein